jgi:hypothetical protein
MPQWKNTCDAANSVNYAIRLVGGAASPQITGKANILANNNGTTFFANTSNSAQFFSNTRPLKAVYTELPWNAKAMANTSGDRKFVQHMGHQLRVGSMGPITGAVVNTAGSGGNFGNGETVIIPGGTVNATLICVSNSTGNLVGFTMNPVSAGLFTNVATIGTPTFVRDRHVTANVTVTGTSSGAGNNAGIYIVVSNSGFYANGLAFSNGQNANLVFTSNATGEPINNTVIAAAFSNTLTTYGVFANTQTTANVVANAFNIANGGAISGLTFIVNIANSTGGAINATAYTLGGRAGRVNYETLVTCHISNTVVGGANTIYNPQ